MVKETVRKAEELAEKFGMSPKDVNFWMVDYDEVYKIVANDGFPNRYPHWRRGMKYKQMKSKGKLGLGEIYELVINDDPCEAYLKRSNEDYIQKAVIAHVMGHSDFFANNEIFSKMSKHMNSNAVEVMERHKKAIKNIMEKESRKEVEEWIDTVLSMEYNIAPYQEMKREDTEDEEELSEKEARNSIRESLGNPSEEIIDEVFSDENVKELVKSDSSTEEKDLLRIFLKNGMKYDEEEGEAVEMEDWEKKVINIIRSESYYFAPQRLTKYMNEGWANYWESKMMSYEVFATEQEYLNFADYVSKILGANRGNNPYKIGREIWEHIEEKESRDELFKKILAVDGIEPRNLFKQVNIESIIDKVTKTEYMNLDNDKLKEIMENNPEDVNTEEAEKYLSGDEVDEWKLLTTKGHSKRHYCFNNPNRRTLIHQTTTQYLKEIYPLVLDKNKFETIDDALENIDYEKGWDKMREVMYTNSDINFIDNFDDELIRKENYVEYEYEDGELREKEVPPDQIREKLRKQVINFGKPVIVVEDTNYKNKKELLLKHKYNGIKMDLDLAKETIKRAHKLWGRKVHLQTIRSGRNNDKIKKEVKISYDGNNLEEKEGDKLNQEYSSSVIYDDYSF